MTVKKHISGVYVHEFVGAARNGDVARVVELIAAYPDILDMPTHAGETALHRATATGQTEVVSVLVSSGASLDVYDNLGYTPLDMAVRLLQVDMIAIFMRRRARTPEIYARDMRMIEERGGRTLAASVVAALRADAVGEVPAKLVNRPRPNPFKRGM